MPLMTYHSHPIVFFSSNTYLLTHELIVMSGTGKAAKIPSLAKRTPCSNAQEDAFCQTAAVLDYSTTSLLAVSFSPAGRRRWHGSSPEIRHGRRKMMLAVIVELIRSTNYCRSPDARISSLNHQQCSKLMSCTFLCGFSFPHGYFMRISLYLRAIFTLVFRMQTTVPHRSYVTTYRTYHYIYISMRI